jgi:hypothetical protein
VSTPDIDALHREGRCRLRFLVGSHSQATVTWLARLSEAAARRGLLG